MTGQLAVCAGSCGPGSLHFINGIYEAQRNRVPLVLIASQVATHELGIDFPQEVEFKPAGWSPRSEESLAGRFFRSDATGCRQR
jgi:thiamine pyrophosphate-dependent acetolactate synthase large subunit-like protein